MDSTYSRDSKGNAFVVKLLDTYFWKECDIIVKVSEPLIRVLHMIDSDERPAMGCLYEAMHRAREDISSFFKNRKERLKPYLKNIDDY